MVSEPSSEGGVLVQEFRAAPGIDLCPTPISFVVAPASEIPPESTPVEVDARIDRLLRETLSLLAERKAMRENLRDTQARSTVILDDSRIGRRFVFAYIRAMEVGDDDLALSLRADLAAWAARPA